MVLFPTFTIALIDTPYNINHLTAKAIITNLVGKKKREPTHTVWETNNRRIYLYSRSDEFCA